MKTSLKIVCLLVVWSYSCRLTETISFSSDGLAIVLDSKGLLTSIQDSGSQSEYINKTTPSPFISARVNGDILAPQKLETLANNIFRFDFEEGVSISIRAQDKGEYLRFEVVDVTRNDLVEMVIWGPYETTITGMIGETVGVAQGNDFSMGLQALNPKTLGGYPWTDNDCMPQINIFAQDDYTDMVESPDKPYVLYRVEAAKPTDDGTSFQAYCRNRNVPRIVENLRHDRYMTSVYNDGGVIGSSIALFGSSTKPVLDIIEHIEIEEGLPHPMIDGVWAKRAPKASSAYIILDFGKDDIEKAIEITKNAGLKYLYHPGPFENWGHFELKEELFPSGRKDLKYCVELAESQGIKVGLHTLSNFITINDPYVTPIPDPRLGQVGYSKLSDEIDEDQSQVSIESPEFFNQFKNNTLQTVRIGEELIRYGRVSESEPWTLLDCERGAFGTTKSRHAMGDTIHKLVDHAYKVFLTDPGLGSEMSKRLAQLYNEVGLRQISFDGLEGNRSTGMGNYGEILFTKTWYDHLNNDVKSHFIADASRTSHFFWHIYSRMNWGEPWYAGFRESQTEYRMKNQPYFKRNLMPGMLGWFRLTSETSVEDIEWMLARSAAYDAGYAFVVDYQSLEENQLSEQILALLGAWETARMNSAFSDDHKKLMENLDNEYHLETLSEDRWELTHINSPKFKHEQKVRQPGEPLHSNFEFEHSGEESPLAFTIVASTGDIQNISLELDHYKSLALPISLKEGETLKFLDGQAVTYDENWNELNRMPFPSEEQLISAGQHKLSFDCEFIGDSEGVVSLELRLISHMEVLEAPPK